MNKTEMAMKLNDYIYKNFGTAAKYAEAKGVTPQYISSVVNGGTEPSKSILKDIGLVKKREVNITYLRA